MMGDRYPSTVQRLALLKLVEALGCRDNALRRDECGDWRINGRLGHVYAIPRGFQIYFRGADEFEEPMTAHGCNIFKEEMAFADVMQDGDREGIFFLGRLPTPDEARIIRTRLRISKRFEFSEEELARRRAWAASMAAQLK